MGNHCSSELCRGQRLITMKLILLTVFATVGLALAESEPEAGHAISYLPYYGYYGYWPYFYKSLGVAAHPTGTSWTQRSVQFRRKRSPDAPVFPSIEAPFGTPHGSAVAPTTWGFPSVKAKRSAEAPVFPSIDAPFGIPHSSAVAPTTWGFPGTKAKRSAEPEANPGLIYYPYAYPLVYIKPAVFPSIDGVFGKGHSSAVETTTFGYPSTKEKRSAEPEANPGLLYYPYLLPVPVVHAVEPIVHKFPESEGEGVAAYAGDATAKIGTTTWGFQ